MDRAAPDAARAELRSAVRGVLGAGSPGVSGVGVGLDGPGLGLCLTVLVDGLPAVSDALARALPDTVGGFPVRTSRRGAGFPG